MVPQSGVPDSGLASSNPHQLLTATLSKKQFNKPMMEELLFKVLKSFNGTNTVTSHKLLVRNNLEVGACNTVMKQRKDKIIVSG